MKMKREDYYSGLGGYFGMSFDEIDYVRITDRIGCCQIWTHKKTYIEINRPDACQQFLDEYKGYLMRKIRNDSEESEFSFQSKKMSDLPEKLQRSIKLATTQALGEECE